MRQSSMYATINVDWIITTRAHKFSFALNLQLTSSRAVQNELETDIRNKEAALGIDITCHQMNNFSRGLQYYCGIEKYNPR